MPAEKDPLTKVYEALWELLEDSSAFCALVPEHNRIKYTSDVRHPERESRKATETPQVLIEAVGGPTAMYRTSDGTSITAQFRIWVLTGDKRLCYLHDGVYQGVLPLQWEILRAMMPWEDTLKLLTWGGVAGFVHHCAVMDRRETGAVAKGAGVPSNPRLDEQGAPVRNAGWSLMWEGEVEMWFQSSALL